MFFPSRFEGMPNSLLDAVALSKLIISSDCQHGPKEIISDILMVYYLKLIYHFSKEEFKENYSH